MRDLTIGFSTYGQPKMLAFWFERYLAEPAEWRDRVEVVVVDDCGRPPARVPKDPGIKLYRIKTDIAWNQPGARNLVSHVAETPRLMLIDPDMTMPEGMLEKLVTEAGHLRSGLVFRPGLRHVGNNLLDHTSPNVHLLLREDFERVRGYDEDYCGHKGWSDVQLLRVMSEAFVCRQRDDLWFWFHHGDKKLPDAQVMTLDRSVAHNRKLHLLKMNTLKAKGWKTFVARTGERLRFQWEKVS